METKFFRPKNVLLQQFIEGYYFLTHSENDHPVTYYTFPNNFCYISLHENVEILFAQNSALLQEQKGKPFGCNLICHYKKPIKFTYQGNIDEITVSFKPLGLNAFLNQPLQTYTNDFFSNFDVFDDYQDAFKAILNEIKLEKKCDLIEAYWLSKLIGFQHAFLNNCVADLKNIQEDYSVARLAAKYNTSRQNLTKQFELHLCKSPSEFKKIHRFREALKINLTKTPKENLTTMGYDLLFYDQSHLTKDFKSLTGLTPKMFFKSVSQLEKGTINWVFI